MMGIIFNALGKNWNLIQAQVFHPIRKGGDHYFPKNILTPERGC